ncbi:type I-F CRISPR-associated endoribonuclease Cas6/Csy4 [Rhodovibrio sodomensis]|uniref:Type I-F CRISPR-associated endoribonuclease Cas6/Csy4 n=1 Tax=Rhodovibrio sodomensis TaxID=1088 RepID=A0ABS1DBU3_9PROT|nr:type I-F CRISPR-associated endoribonuclease Cas6/Csy4 [Rhodovibrio sodomensis]MBK1667607.1 type I-F CRISPR-associated endoribonuclease Cas6/Csy4 [Rhodovibrio sodomensis]
MFSCYADIRYSRQAKLLIDENSPALAQGVFAALHGWNTAVKADDQRIAGSLPRMTLIETADDGRIKDLADCLGLVRVFGREEAHLDAFLADHRIGRLVETGMIKRPRVREVEIDDDTEFAVYTRDRAADQLTPAAIDREERRYARRAKARGLERASEEIVRARCGRLAQKNRDDRKLGPKIFVPMRSRSTDNPFSLVIRREVREAPAEGLLNTYGLSRADACIAVPEI